MRVNWLGKDCQTGADAGLSVEGCGRHTALVEAVPARPLHQVSFEHPARNPELPLAPLLASFFVAHVDYTIQIFKLPYNRVPRHVQDFSDLIDTQEFAAEFFPRLINN